MLFSGTSPFNIQNPAFIISAEDMQAKRKRNVEFRIARVQVLLPSLARLGKILHIVVVVVIVIEISLQPSQVVLFDYNDDKRSACASLTTTTILKDGRSVPAGFSISAALRLCAIHFLFRTEPRRHGGFNLRAGRFIEDTVRIIKLPEAHPETKASKHLFEERDIAVLMLSPLSARDYEILTLHFRVSRLERY